MIRSCGTQRPPEAVSFRRPTDAIDACDERTTTYSVPATARACRQASNDAMPPPQRTPALHAIDGTAAALRCCTPPPVACWLRTLHASPRRSKRDSRARRPCPPHVRARCLSASCRLRLEMRARCRPTMPQGQDRRRREATLYASSSSSSCGVFCWRGVVLANFSPHFRHSTRLAWPLALSVNLKRPGRSIVVTVTVRRGGGEEAWRTR